MTRRAYYNENDPFAAAWLRALIARRLIAAGDVDTRDIREVRCDDLRGYTQVHLFAGIGGWSRALRLARWPDEAPIWTGSCPCQPFSTCGLRRGTRDPRHLWPQMRRLIAERRPAICAGEQVESPAGRRWLAGVRADLEAMDYAVGAADLCAAGAGAPHVRQRLFWAAHANGARSRNARSSRALFRHRSAGLQRAERLALAKDDRLYRRITQSDAERAIAMRSVSTARAGAHGFWDRFEVIACLDQKRRRVEPGSFPLADGIPGRVGMLRGYGNAIVPQIAALFILAFQEAREQMSAI